MSGLISKVVVKADRPESDRRRAEWAW